MKKKRMQITKENFSLKAEVPPRRKRLFPLIT